VPIYPTLALLAAAAVVLAELTVLRTGIFRQPAYWLAMVVSFLFMIPVDGWLTKLSAPIVIYRDADVSGLRPIWDILAEEYAYAFALLTLVIALWERAGRGEDAGAR
jgi:lycopene cyclase domain-containing protein